MTHIPQGNIGALQSLSGRPIALEIHSLCPPLSIYRVTDFPLFCSKMPYSTGRMLASKIPISARNSAGRIYPSPTRARTKENTTETNLRRLVLGGQTVKNLRANLSSIKVNVSLRKPSQVHVSHGRTDSQVNASFQFAITCDLSRPTQSPYKLPVCS